MSSTLIIYSSTDGHTKTICERITNFSNDKNMVKIISLNEAPKLEISKFDITSVTGISIASVVPETLVNIKSLIKKIGL